jgi:hypothetical protein
MRVVSWKSHVLIALRLFSQQHNSCSPNNQLPPSTSPLPSTPFSLANKRAIRPSHQRLPDRRRSSHGWRFHQHNNQSRKEYGRHQTVTWSITINKKLCAKCIFHPSRFFTHTTFYTQPIFSSLSFFTHLVMKTNDGIKCSVLFLRSPSSNLLPCHPFFILFTRPVSPSFFIHTATTFSPSISFPPHTILITTIAPSSS